MRVGSPQAVKPLCPGEGSGVEQGFLKVERCIGQTFGEDEPLRFGETFTGC